MTAAGANAEYKPDYNYVDMEGNRASLNPETSPQDKPSRYAVKNQLMREFMAETLAVFVMMCFGLGGTAQAILTHFESGSFTQIVLSWGIGVMFGIHMAAGVSGSHLNPAVTIPLAIFGFVPWKKVPMYVTAQTLGAFLGTAMIYIIYRPLLNVVDPDRLATHVVFATFPHEGVDNFTCFVTEMLATALLVGGILAVLDQHNHPVNAFTAPATVGLLVIGCGFALGVNTSLSINPARDFGPRFFMLCAGWGSKVFTMNSYYFWIPLVAPLVGGCIGCAVYIGLVGLHHTKNVDPNAPRGGGLY